MARLKKLCSVGLILVLLVSCMGGVVHVQGASLGDCEECVCTYRKTGKGSHIRYCTECKYARTEACMFNENYICIYCGTDKMLVGRYNYTYKPTDTGHHVWYGSDFAIEEVCILNIEGNCIYCKQHVCGKYAYENFELQGHRVICGYCGEYYDEEHTMSEDGMSCAYCDYTLSVHECYFLYEDNNDGTHRVYCTDCEIGYSESHTYSEDGYCIYCGSKEEMVHECEWFYYDNWDGTHTAYCNGCDLNYIEDHIYVDGRCVDCDAQKEEHRCDFTYIDNKDGTHQKICNGCKKMYREEHLYSEDRCCIYCKAKQKEDVEPAPGTGGDTTDYTYTSMGNGAHMVRVKSENGEAISYVEECSYVNGSCEYCGYKQESEEIPHACEFTYIDNGDGTHQGICNGCKKMYSEAHLYNKDDRCEACGTYAIRIEEVKPKIIEISNVAKGIRIAWEEVNIADGYYVFRKIGKGNWKKVKQIDETVWIDTKATKNGEKYQYKVYAYKGDLESDASETTTIYCLAKKNISVAKNVKGRKLRLKWQTNAKASGYEIQYAMDNVFDDAVSVYVTGGKKKEKIIKKLAKGQKYFVRVRSYKKIGKKKQYAEWSNIKTVTIKK